MKPEITVKELRAAKRRMERTIAGHIMAAFDEFQRETGAIIQSVYVELASHSTLQCLPDKAIVIDVQTRIADL